MGMRYAVALVAGIVLAGCSDRTLGQTDGDLVAVGDFQIERDPRPDMLPYAKANDSCLVGGLALPTPDQWTKAMQAGAIAIIPGNLEWLANEYSVNFDQSFPLETVVSPPGSTTLTRDSFYRCVR